MTDPATGQDGFLADPGSVIVGIVHGAEPSLDRDVIAASVTRTAPSRAQQRRLAAALSDDPGLLTSGWSAPRFSDRDSAVNSRCYLAI